MTENQKLLILGLVGVLVLGFFCGQWNLTKQRENDERKPTPTVTSIR